MKKITIHQPQYIPWTAYFDKILNSDTFILLDNVQFQKNGLQNRNQIKTPQGKLWLTLPVNHSLGQLISDVVISDTKIKEKHLRSFTMNYSKSKYFGDIFEIVESSLGTGSNSLSDISIDLIKKILDYLGYNGEIILSSDLSVSTKASELILDICKTVGAGKYISGMGGLNYLMRKDFEAAGIEVIFQKFKLDEHKQCFPKIEFISDLSIIDLLFNVGSESRNLIDQSSSSYLNWDDLT